MVVVLRARQTVDEWPADDCVRVRAEHQYTLELNRRPCIAGGIGSQLAEMSSHVMRRVRKV